MTKTRSALLAAVFFLAALLAVLVAQGPGPPPGPLQFAGSGFALPHETPFPDAQRVSLDDAITAAPFPIYRPDHPLASDESITDVWVRVQARDEDADTQVALWYSSGLEIQMWPVSPNDTAPLVADFPEGFPVSYERIGGTEVRVIPPGIQGPEQSGSVTMVKEGLLVSLIGWLPDLTIEDLRDIASTVALPQDSGTAGTISP
jgi:hypothetical protein